MLRSLIFNPSITTKVLSGFSIIILVMIVTGSVLYLTFDSISQTFSLISSQKFQTLVATSGLVAESERMEGKTADVIIAENQFVRESLLQEVNSLEMRWKKLTTMIQMSSAYTNEITNLLDQSDQIKNNIEILTDITSRRIKYDERVNKLIKRVYRLGGRINGCEYLPCDKHNNKINRYYENWNRFIEQAIITILIVPKINSADQIKKMRAKFVRLMKKAEIELMNMPINLKLELVEYHNEVHQHGTNYNNIFEISLKNLELTEQINRMVVNNKFISSKLINSVDSIYYDIQKDITDRGQRLSDKMRLMKKLVVMLPVVAFTLAIIIFFYLKRSVIRRIHQLNNAMISHVKGNPVDIDIKGTDEIADMAASVKYFIAEISLREAKLRENEEKYRNLFNTAPVGIYRIDSVSNKIYAANHSAAQIFGFDDIDSFVNNFKESEYYVDYEQYKTFRDVVKQNIRLENFEILSFGTDGEQTYLSLSAVYYPTHHYIECAVVDITELRYAQEMLRQSHLELENKIAERTRELNNQNIVLKQEIDERILAENALRESEERYRLLAENMRQALILVEVESGRIIYANSEFEDLITLGVIPRSLLRLFGNATMFG